MKKLFTPSELELVKIHSEDIITTSPVYEEEEETYPRVTIGPGGNIGLPIDPFSN